MTAGIFINYRRQDTIATAGRLYDRLVQAFGAKRIFMDVDHVRAGADFIDQIAAELSKCTVLLVLIGPRWLDIRDEAGSRRLSNPDDLVAREIEMALHRGINVIPVLVDGANMPQSASLPDALKPLARRNALELRNAQFGRDAERLVERIAELLNRRTKAAKRTSFLLAGIPISVSLVVLAAFFFASSDVWRSSRKINIVDDCGTLEPSTGSIEFSGVFSGVIVDGGQGGAEIQIKLVRNRNAVNGNYLRAGVCGTISGEVTGNRMAFRWSWTDSSGQGVAVQAGNSLSGTSGLGNSTEGAATFILFRRNPSETR